MKRFTGTFTDEQWQWLRRRAFEREESVSKTLADLVKDQMRPEPATVVTGEAQPRPPLNFDGVPHDGADRAELFKRRTQ